MVGGAPWCLPPMADRAAFEKAPTLLSPAAVLDDDDDDVPTLGGPLFLLRWANVAWWRMPCAHTYTCVWEVPARGWLATPSSGNADDSVCTDTRTPSLNQDVCCAVGAPLRRTRTQVDRGDVG